MVASVLGPLRKIDRLEDARTPEGGPGREKERGEEGEGEERRKRGERGEGRGRREGGGRKASLYRDWVPERRAKFRCSSEKICRRVGEREYADGRDVVPFSSYTRKIAVKMCCRGWREDDIFWSQPRLRANPGGGRSPFAISTNDVIVTCARCRVAVGPHVHIGKGA